MCDFSLLLRTLWDGKWTAREFQRWDHPPPSWRLILAFVANAVAGQHCRQRLCTSGRKILGRTAAAAGGRRHCGGAGNTANCIDHKWHFSNKFILIQQWCIILLYPLLCSLQGLEFPCRHAEESGDRQVFIKQLSPDNRSSVSHVSAVKDGHLSCSGDDPRHRRTVAGGNVTGDKIAPACAQWHSLACMKQMGGWVYSEITMDTHSYAQRPRQSIPHMHLMYTSLRIRIL